MARDNYNPNINKHEQIAERHSLIESILFLILMASNIVPPEIISVIIITVVVFLPIAIGLKIPRGIWFAIWPIVLMTIIGIFGLLNNELSDCIKDFWYFGKAVLIIVFGYLLMSRIKNLEIILSLFVVSAVVISGWHILSFLADLTILRESVDVISERLGTGYMLAVVGASILLLSNHFNLELRYFRTKLLKKIAMSICILSVVLSFSRTLWISLLIFIILNMALSEKKYIRASSIAGLLIIVLFFTSSTIASTFQDAEGAFGSIMRKITRSINEVVISDYSNMKDINIHWRGYEAYQALQTYKSGGLKEYLFGHGFGKLIDLGFYMPVEQISMRYIPTVHNGYLYILVKTGLIGLFLYIFYLIKILWKGITYANSENPMVKSTCFLLIGLSLVIFTTTYSIAGLYNKNVLFSVNLLLGCVLCHFNFIKAK